MRPKFKVKLTETAYGWTWDIFSTKQLLGSQNYKTKKAAKQAAVHFQRYLKDSVLVEDK